MHQHVEQLFVLAEYVTRFYKKYLPSVITGPLQSQEQISGQKNLRYKYITEQEHEKYFPNL